MADKPKQAGEDAKEREKKHVKPKLNIDQQIAHLKAKGVKFEKRDEKQARAYLSHECDFYELTSYRKLFSKRQGGEHDGEYASLDFAQLVAFAELDESLRDAMFVITRQIEHYQGTELNYVIDERDDEDGYAIVKDFFSSVSPDSKGYMEKEFGRSAFSPYTRGIHEKYSDDKSAWAFLKVASFGSLVDFMRFCGSRWGDERLSGSHYNMKRVKSVRNCAAHGSCIINSFAEVDNAKRPASREVDEAADLLPKAGPDAKAAAAINFIKSLTRSLGLLE